MYDFENTIDRRATDSIKWSGAPNDLPMWIADMDFKTAPEIQAAMAAKVAQGIFGYEEPHADYFNAVADWYQAEHNAHIDSDWMLFATGVIPAISATVRRVSNVGDNVVVTAPVYNMFYNSIENSGRHVLSSDLQYDRATGHYAIDFADLEQKLAAPLSTMMILCNPHNPIGRIWTRSELTHIAELCQKYGVTLLSDEIHGDLRLTDTDYTPAFTLPEALIQNLIVCVSPSKTFNVAAMHAATVIVPNEHLRNIVNRGLNTDEVAEPNLLAIPGTIAAYTKGHAWLAELRNHLQHNYQLVADFCAQSAIPVRLVPADATYLLWLDISDLTDDSATLTKFIHEHTGLQLSSGDVYRGNGNDFLRINIACPEAMLRDGLHRLATGLAAFQAQ
jgi:cystathionine beta-lyase